MSLYNDASLIVTPNGYKEGKLFSIVPTDGSGDLSVTRATTATYVGSDGLIKTAGVNEARLDYTNASCPSILVEPQRTNLLPYSSTFTGGGWVADESTITNNYSLSPDGAINANRWLSDLGSAISAITSNISVSDNTTYTISCWVKSNGNGKDKFKLIISSGFDGLLSADYTATSEWQRFTYTGTRLTKGSRFGLTRPSDNSEVDLQIYGIQVEESSNATSYIPTTTSSVTRNADVISKSNVYTENLITSSGGSWFVELDNNIEIERQTVSGGFYLKDIDVLNTLGNGIMIRNSSSISQRISIFKTINDVGTTLFQTTTDYVKILIKWNGSTMDVFVNGVKEVDATSFTPTVFNYLTANPNKTLEIKNSFLFPMPISDEQAIQLTTL